MPAIDPPNGPRYVLEGRVVTMADAPAQAVLDRGAVYVDKGTIVAVRDAKDPAPAGFGGAGVERIATGGTIYPGLIELHNHLSYDVLPLWDVPKKYGERGEWQGAKEYERLISWPMKALGTTPGYLEAVVRYVECKCLVAGVTTSQGVTLKMFKTRRYYRGTVRNVENTGEKSLPHAATKVSDVEAKSAAKFAKQLASRKKAKACLLLHLAEGKNAAALTHFEALEHAPGAWAINEALAGIHATALRAKDLAVLGQHGGAIVWSPLSNLLLYGDTTNVKAARKNGVRVALGADWSPSGSKNLLAELKVARLVNAHTKAGYTDRDLVAMVTRVPAQILGWDGAIGSIEDGKKADLVVVHGRGGDPYRRLLDARESSVSLVVINGWPRCGRTSFMKRFGLPTEKLAIGGSQRALYLEHDDDDPLVEGLTLAKAKAKLRDGMKRLRDLGHAIDNPPPGPASSKKRWVLELDHDDLGGHSMRHHLPDEDGVPSGADPAKPAMQPAAGPWYEQLTPMRLDPLTVRDDAGYWKRIAAGKNLPPYLRTALAKLD